MEDMINPESAKLETGATLDSGLVIVDIIRQKDGGNHIWFKRC